MREQVTGNRVMTTSDACVAIAEPVREVDCMLLELGSVR